MGSNTRSPRSRSSATTQREINHSASDPKIRPRAKGSATASKARRRPARRRLIRQSSTAFRMIAPSGGRISGLWASAPSRRGSARRGKAGRPARAEPPPLAAPRPPRYPERRVCRGILIRYACLKCSTVTSFGNRDHGLTDLARDAAALIKAVGGRVTVFSPLFGGQIDHVQRRETLLVRKVSRGY